MALRKRIDKRREPMTPGLWAYLTDAEWPAEVSYFEWFAHECNDDETRCHWKANRDPILTNWIKTKPGTRPRCWWRFEAPERLPYAETQAAYLKRHGLLMAGEARRVKEAG
jgi:hypothetical protein